MLVMTNPMKARAILEMGLAEWRKQETLKKHGTSISKFADYLDYSQAAVSQWMNGKKDIAEDALIFILPKLVPLLGLEIYDELEMQPPDQDFERLSKIWNYIPPKIRHSMREQGEQYATEKKHDEGNERRTTKKPA